MVIKDMLKPILNNSVITIHTNDTIEYCKLSKEIRKKLSEKKVGKK